LKAENHLDPTQSVETDAFTTVADAWEVIEFDFNNESLNTAPLNPAFPFTMLSIFFNFGTEGAAVGDQTYFFDNVSFNEPIVSNVLELTTSNERLVAMPNPSPASWDIVFEGALITDWQLLDARGRIVATGQPNIQAGTFRVDGDGLPAGLYHLKVFSGNDRPRSTRLVKVAN
jgi:hypothetical protein